MSRGLSLRYGAGIVQALFGLPLASNGSDSSNWVDTVAPFGNCGLM